MSDAAMGQALGRRLASFVRSFQTLRPTTAAAELVEGYTTGPALGERLTAFLRQARHFTPEAEPASPQLTSERLRYVLLKLRDALVLGHPPFAEIRIAKLLEPDSLRVMLPGLGHALGKARLNGDFINPWVVTGLRDKEVRNAAALAWLLSPRGSHGLGPVPLDRLFAALKRADPTWSPDMSSLSGCSVRTEYRPQASERDRVDLAISGPGLLLFLEVKIGAPEGPEQLDRYVESARAQAHLLGIPASVWRVAYLTIRPSPPRPDIIALTWRRLVADLQSALPRNSATTRSIQQLLSHFASFGG